MWKKWAKNLIQFLLLFLQKYGEPSRSLVNILTWLIKREDSLDLRYGNWTRNINPYLRTSKDWSGSLSNLLSHLGSLCWKKMLNIYGSRWTLAWQQRRKNAGRKLLTLQNNYFVSLLICVRNQGSSKVKLRKYRESLILSWNNLIRLLILHRNNRYFSIKSAKLRKELLNVNSLSDSWTKWNLSLRKYLKYSLHKLDHSLWLLYLYLLISYLMAYIS